MVEHNVSWSIPYGQHHYFGEHENDASATALIQAQHWDSTGNGQGSAQDGAMYFNTTTHRLRVCSLGAWKNTSPACGYSVVNFGSSGVNAASVTVSGQVDITTSAHITASFQGSTPNHSEMDHMMAGATTHFMGASIVAGESFVILIMSDTPLVGQYCVRWQWIE